MIDMGEIDGQRVFYTGITTWGELIEAGKIVAIPSTTEGIIYKRPERCTPVPLAARLTLAEAERITAKWNSKLDS